MKLFEDVARIRNRKIAGLIVTFVLFIVCYSGLRLIRYLRAVETETQSIEIQQNRFEVGRTVFLNDDNWGQTCNKLQLIAGTFRRLRIEHPSIIPYRILLNPETSRLVQVLNQEQLSRSAEIFTNCLPADASSFKGIDRLQFDNPCYQCNRSIFQGKSTIPTQQICVAEVYTASDIFWKFGPSKMGLMREFIQDIAPMDMLMYAAASFVSNVRENAAEHALVLGVHRRHMDGHCYEWLADPIEYDCGRGAKWLKNPVQIHSVVREQRPRSWTEWKQLEPLHPYLVVCNYTLDAAQIKLIVESTNCSSESGTMVAIIASDKQDIWGDNAILASAQVRKATMIDHSLVNQLFPAEFLVNDFQKEAQILIEIAILAFSDIHLGNPLSSCDVIVAHWRRSLQKNNRVKTRPSSSSFPSDCYDGFYFEDL